MTKLRFVVGIPARWASERLPGKALADLDGKPMVVRCLEVARASGAATVVVATDDRRVAEAVHRAGGEARMTADTHRSGTDRLAEVADRSGWHDDLIVVNLQGDEPLIPPSLLHKVAATLAARPYAALSTVATPLRSREELHAEQVVKVVVDARGRALYFSRAPIPWARGRMAPDAPLPPELPCYRHLGLYAYRVGTLRRLARARLGALEQVEALEQLRALELGMTIHVHIAPTAPLAGVDTEADLERVRRAIGAGET